MPRRMLRRSVAVRMQAANNRELRNNPSDSDVEEVINVNDVNVNQRNLTNNNESVQEVPETDTSNEVINSSREETTEANVNSTGAREEEATPANVSEEASSSINVESNSVSAQAVSSIELSPVSSINQQPQVIENNADIATPSPAKKRKRTSRGTPKIEGTPNIKNGDNDANAESDDDGCTCPVCFDKWEMTGDHRLVALRCGHLFGESCIRRWLLECGRQSGAKMCPQCKTKAVYRDIRHLYAKRVRVIDRSEEHNLRQSLEENSKKIKAFEMEISMLKMRDVMSERRLHELEAENKHLKLTLCQRPTIANSNSDSISCINPLNDLRPSKTYRLFMEHNITISREPGCRVLAYSKEKNLLLVSQKSANALFPGYGVRLIDVSNFRPQQFVHLTANMLRDISFSADQQIIACTSMEPSAKLYDFRLREAVSIISPVENKNLWACALGAAYNEKTLYLGSHNGGTLVFDIRFPNAIVAEYESVGDLSPVINIIVLPRNEDFPNGGICVCKLQSVWFYENSGNDTTAAAFRLDVEGPFMAMCFDPLKELIILTARISSRYPESRFIAGRIKKIDSHGVFEPYSTLFGSKATPVMTRGCQINSTETSWLFTAYLQDAKQLALFDVRRQLRLQSLPVSGVIYDTCAIYTTRDTYLAALTENKCRIYKLNES